MKHFVAILSYLMLCVTLDAQQISVESFRPLENDLTANTRGTMERDLNGETAALIKVVTTQTGFNFEAGILGIVKTVQRQGEIWVYVPRKSRRITITHSQLGVLRDYIYPCAIEAGRTYEMVLTTGEVITTVIKDRGGNMLAVTVNPPNSSLFINDEIKSLNYGQHSQFYPYGEYTYRVESVGYIPEAGVFSIVPDEKTVIEINLVSALAALTVECPTSGCDIYINESWKGTGTYTEEVVDGTYLVEVRKNGYRTYMETVTLLKQEKRTVTAPALIPIEGSLMVNVQPVGAAIDIDGVRAGTTPEIFDHVLIGTHTVKISKSGYDDMVRQVEITENGQSELSGGLVKKTVPVTCRAEEETSSNSASRKPARSFVPKPAAVRRVRVPRQRTYRVRSSSDLCYMGFGYEAGFCPDEKNSSWYADALLGFRIGRFTDVFQFELGAAPGMLSVIGSDKGSDSMFHLPVYGSLKFSARSGLLYLKAGGAYNAVRNEYYEGAYSIRAGIGSAWNNFEWDWLFVQYTPPPDSSRSDYSYSDYGYSNTGSSSGSYLSVGFRMVWYITL